MALTRWRNCRGYSGDYRGAGWYGVRLSFGTLQRGNAGRDALRRREDAERPERHATRSVAR
ncbi:DUF1534 domain-containing protein [Pseudomonas syringae]|nr:DUF1534 domain-containing protein [Pseudomonas syringae]